MALTMRRDRERRDFWKNKIKRNNYFRKMIVCRHRVVSALNCDILRMENMNPMLKQELRPCGSVDFCRYNENYVVTNYVINIQNCV